MPHIETTDLSFIADRVQPQTWTLFQVLRTRMRQMKGVTMKVQYEKHTREPIPAFFYGSRQLFHVHARGEEIDRKSTRLNSSHRTISYAVFCLKKKKKKKKKNKKKKKK